MTPGWLNLARKAASPSGRSEPEPDGAVSVTVKSLIRLRHQAASLSLSPTRIRAVRDGGYLSPFKGRGMEFEEARPYQPGDDMRSIEWRVTARSGRVHTKVFREERERPVLLWTDLRPPMFFGTRRMLKSVLAARVAALLAWAAAAHGDRIGGLIFSDGEHTEVRPQRGTAAVLQFLHQLAHHSAWGTGGEGDAGAESTTMALARLGRVARPGSLLFLLSDLRGLNEEAERHLVQLARHNDVIAIFSYDALEAALPPAGMYRVSYRQTELVLNTADSRFRREYATRFAARRDGAAALCRRHRIYFQPCATDEDPLRILRDSLGLRKRT